jgi:hypothetical protein
LFKSASTKRINQSRHTPGARVWQRNYHEHVIRDEADLAKIRGYIANNPRKWDIDHQNPPQYRTATPSSASGGRSRIIGYRIRSITQLHIKEEGAP